jgi:hypothetical protein
VQHIKGLEVICFDYRMLAAVRILRIPSICLLEEINNQALLVFSFFYLSDEFVVFYYLSVVKLHLSHGFIHVGSYSLRGLGLSPSNCQLQPYSRVSTRFNV